MKTERLLEMVMAAIEYLEEYNADPKEILGITEEEYQTITNLFDVSFE